MKSLLKLIHRIGIITCLFLTLATQTPSTARETEDNPYTNTRIITGYEPPEWAETQAINNPVYNKSWKARFMSFYRNPPVSGTTIAVTSLAFGIGFALLYYNYDPTVMVTFLAQKFFNDSSLGMDPNSWRIDTNLPYPNCFDSCLNLPVSFVPHADFADDPYHGPGYYTSKPDDQIPGVYDDVFNKGNLSDMIKTIQHLCGCDGFDHWYEYAVSIINGSKFDPAIAHCFPNKDNITMCCGSGWGWDTWPGREWKPDDPLANLSIRMVNGSGPCAQAYEYQAWSTRIGTFSFFGGLAPITATGLALWSRYFG